MTNTSLALKTGTGVLSVILSSKKSDSMKKFQGSEFKEGKDTKAKHSNSKKVIQSLDAGFEILRGNALVFYKVGKEFD